MSNKSFHDTLTPHEAIVSVLAQDPYVMHVVDHQERDIMGAVIEHDVRDWKGEMLDHLQERYDVSRNIGHAVISKCRSNFRQSSGAKVDRIER